MNSGISLHSCPHYRVVTLLEILETSAEAWWRMASMTGQLLVRLESSFPPAEQIGQTLGELQRECQKLELFLAYEQLERIKETALNNVGMNLVDLGMKLRSMVYEVNLRIWDELKTWFFIVIPTHNLELYKQLNPLFGANVEEKFSQMSEDISEAGKCIALNRPTAAVFHLMRIMELAVQKFGSKLDIELVSELRWQVILDQINKRIKQGDHKLDKTKSFAETAAHLYSVKVAWRNEVMHPKQTYTPDEARAIFSSVGIFIRDLAEKF